MGKAMIEVSCAAVVFELGALGLDAEICHRTGKVVLRSYPERKV